MILQQKVRKSHKVLGRGRLKIFLAKGKKQMATVCPCLYVKWLIFKSFFFLIFQLLHRMKINAVGKWARRPGFRIRFSFIRIRPSKKNWFQIRQYFKDRTRIWPLLKNRIRNSVCAPRALRYWVSKNLPQICTVFAQVYRKYILNKCSIDMR